MRKKPQKITEKVKEVGSRWAEGSGTNRSFWSACEYLVLSFEQCFILFCHFPLLFAFVVGGLGFELCVFVAGWRHALRSEWPFIIIIIIMRISFTLFLVFTFKAIKNGDVSPPPSKTVASCVVGWWLLCTGGRADLLLLMWVRTVDALWLTLPLPSPGGPWRPYS